MTEIYAVIDIHVKIVTAENPNEALNNYTESTKNGVGIYNRATIEIVPITVRAMGRI